MDKITQEKAIELASSLLKVSAGALESRPLDDGAGFYVYQPIRGGGALVVANDNTVLFANSSMNPDEHLKAFYEGKRTNTNLFQ